LLLLCGNNPLDDPRSANGKEKFRGLAPGSLSMAYEDDWSRAYYVYYYPGVGGFYIEGDMDAFDDPECGDKVVPRILGFLKERGLPADAERLLEIILSRRVFTTQRRPW
jgi:hypothetical protein